MHYIKAQILPLLDPPSLVPCVDPKDTPTFKFTPQSVSQGTQIAIIAIAQYC
jgi:hypothetical protein